MRALGDAGKGRCEHVVSLRLQRLPNARPAPTTVPCSMNQNIRAHQASVAWKNLAGFTRFRRASSDSATLKAPCQESMETKLASTGSAKANLPGGNGTGRCERS